MKSIETYLGLYRAMGRSSFLAAHPHPFLVVDPQKPAAEDQNPFATKAVSRNILAEVAAMGPGGTAPGVDDDQTRVLKVVKAPDSPWQSRISVGRARNNDVVLGDSSVSKLHAHINILDNGDYTMTDVGSSNGTVVNGKRLSPSDPVPVGPGARIQFGDVVTTFNTNNSFCDFLDAQA